MHRQRETNPHFLPHRNDSIIEFPSQTPSSVPPRSRPPPPHRGRTTVEPPYGPRPQPPQQPLKPLRLQAPLQPHQDRPDSQHAGRGQHPTGHGHHPHPFMGAPTSQRTNPLAWLLAAFCVLFWIIIIVGGLIILIVYLVFRPRNPRFDISTATINAAYLDMGYLLNAEVTVLANFTNPNTKVHVDFSYVTLDLYYDRSFVATRYIEPFSVPRRESRFADVHLEASQVRLSMGQSLQLQRQMDSGRVNFEIRGFFKATSKLGGIFQYSYGLHAHCQIAVTGPPTGVLIGKKCVTRR
ncbi:hypothetical protein CDL12_26092 [Handroanthus impetiginosus]|uniref:Late embryogenesis abundant protein LEA-2 subgroup domain-containing protein n=1 Tax=Handroanthus impetiginosus TaxID=429701 RepID=A0A2G9G7W2_9LAMI|nr:hypothetical protein CDL12_26092 [Handroanthus impetiginosus]